VRRGEPFDFEMTPAKLWLSIFLTGFTVAFGLLVQTLMTPVPYGDLAVELQ
jgi:hypothetical protein